MQAVIFDHDGTLVDSEGSHHKIWQRLLKRWGIDFSLQEYIQGHAGVPTLQNAKSLFDTYDISLKDHNALFRMKEAETQAQLKKAAFPLLPFVKDTLSACQNLPLRIGLATGASQVEVNSTLRGHGLQHFFETVATRDEVENSKPAPDVYLLAAQNLQCPAEQCIAVEDSESGVRAAKSAGMYCIAIPNAFSQGHDLSSANYLASDLKSALARITSLVA